VPNADAQVLKFQSGETDAIAQLSAENFSVLSRQRRGYMMVDAGPGLEYNFLFFNLNDLGEKAAPELARKQKWFREVRFRQAVSAAVDKEAIVRLVYQGRGTPLWGLVAPGNRRWGNEKLAHPPRSLERRAPFCKRRILLGRWAECRIDAPGFRWQACGILHAYELIQRGPRQDGHADSG